MNEKNASIRNPDKRLAAVCGLFCPACSVFIGTREDQGRLKVIARRFQRSLEELQCNGCRSEKRCFYCESKCTMTKCAAAKGVEFCGECTEYPCMDLKAFQSEMPHRIELWKSQERIAALPSSVLADERMRRIMEATRWAPSWMNKQPWSFILTGQEVLVYKMRLQNREGKDLPSSRLRDRHGASAFSGASSGFWRTMGTREIRGPRDARR